MSGVTIGTKDDKNVKIVYNQVRDMIGKKLETGDIINLVVRLIPIVQKVVVGKHEGGYKKMVVITVLEMIITDSDLDNDAKAALHLLVQTTIPITIDTMINIANGNINLAKHAKTCFSSCFGN